MEQSDDDVRTTGSLAVPIAGVGAGSAAGGRNDAAVLNAANEVAVARFLSRDVAFTDIPAIVGAVLARYAPRPAATLEAVLDADAWARREAAAVSPAA
jgi:1-deoxy-D-xylulose-5-phosphate reductoisomerase